MQPEHPCYSGPCLSLPAQAETVDSVTLTVAKSISHELSIVLSNRRALTVLQHVHTDCCEVNQPWIVSTVQRMSVNCTAACQDTSNTAQHSPDSGSCEHHCSPAHCCLLDLTAAAPHLQSDNAAGIGPPFAVLTLHDGSQTRHWAAEMLKQDPHGCRV